MRAWTRAVRRLLPGAAAPPQLVMWYPQGRSPPSPELEEGYGLRPHCVGDDAAWLALLEANGELGAWDLERLQRDAKGQLAPGTPLFALQGERIVAAAGVYGRSVAGVTSWEVGWVACHPCHAGKGLGRAATASAVQAALTLERRPIVLKTDDHRIAAVKSYLRLGFVPEYGHPTYPSRWEAIFAKLGPESAPNDREA